MTSAGRVNLRGRRAVILHPPDTDIQDLGRQLSRIGLSVSFMWPSSAEPLTGGDFLFAALSDDLDVSPIIDGLKTYGHGVRVVIIENESPTILEKLIEIDADAVIVKPIRPAGLLANLVHALHKRRKEAALDSKVDRLERKLAGSRAVERAKEILCARQCISGDEAFALLRQTAMNERLTIEQVSSTIVDADRFVSAKVS